MKYIRKHIIQFIFFCCATILQAQQKNTELPRLLEKAALVQQFSRIHPQEKVYLHFDNTGYFIGETIWFKAYVTRSDSDHPTNLSGVLYVELLNPSGEVVERRKLKLENGQAHGDIRLDKILTSGFYEVRAYTRYMTNWGAGACFSRVFPVFEELKEEGNYERASINNSAWRRLMPDMREDSDTQKKRTKKKQKEEIAKEKIVTRPKGTYTTESRGITLHIYPEGGNHIYGLEGRIAFQLIDREGMPVTGTVQIVRPDGITDVQGIGVDSLGRGLFSYTPDYEPAELVLTQPNGKTSRFKLPDAEQEGCALRVNTLNEDKIYVETAVSNGLYGRLWGMTLQNGGTVVASHSFRTGEKPYTFFLSRKDMPLGVSQITIFDGEGRIWAERMVFIPPQPEDADSIRLELENGQLHPCGKIRIIAKTEPKTTFSFSARDIATSTGGYNGNVRTWMLLASELKGYVHRPEYYFEADDLEHRKAADLLMLIQGWRKYDWRVMAGTEPALLKEPIEDKLYIDGTVFPDRKKQETDGLRLTAYLYNRNGESMKGKTRTDSAGHYAFSIPDCTGRWSLFLKAEGRTKKQEDFRIGIRRDFSPVPPRTFNWLETRPVPESRKGRLKFAGFEDTGTLAPPQEKRHILMPTVHVDERWVYENPRVAWEKENVGKKKAFLYYDCDAATNRISDKGEELPAFQDWLKEQNEYFVGETYVIHDKTPQEDFREEVKLMNPEYANNNDRFKLLMNQMKIGSSVIDKKYNIYKDGLTYHNRPIVWVIDNSYHSLTGINYNHPPNPGDTEDSDKEEEDLGSVGSTSKGRMMSKPELKVSYCRTTSHRNAEMPLFLDEVKSVYIADDQSTWRDFIRFKNENVQMPVTVFVYTHHSFLKDVNGLRRTYFEGYNVPSTFEMNDYSLLPPMKDFRRTLYWDPDVTTDKNGKAVIEFYNNSSCKEIQVSAEGITNDGKCIFNK